MLELNITLDGVSFSGTDGLSLGGDSLASLVSFSLLLIIVSASLEETFSRSRKSNVVVSDVDSLGDNSVSELLVNNNTDGSRVDVENSTGLTVVKVVGHTLVDGTVNNDINVVTDSVGGQDLRDTDGTVLSETLGEL